MTVSISTPADVLNIALARLGVKKRIGNLYEGTIAANKALDIYAQTRDAVLRETDWNFSQKIAAAAVAAGSTAPALYPYVYDYPTDCIKIRNMYGVITDADNPTPVLWTIADDVTNGTVIWSNVPSATLVYTARVTTITQWEPLFVEALAGALSRRLTPLLASLDLVKTEAEDEKVASEIGASTEG